MSNEEFDKEVSKIDKCFQTWLEKRSDLLEVPIKESLGDAFFDGYDKGKKQAQEDYANTPCNGCQITSSLEESLEESYNRELDLIKEKSKLKAQIEKMKSHIKDVMNDYNNSDLNHCLQDLLDRWEMDN